MNNKITAVLLCQILIFAIVAIPTILADATKEVDLKELLKKETLNEEDLKDLTALTPEKKNAVIKNIQTVKIDDKNKKNAQAIISQLISEGSRNENGLQFTLDTNVELDGIEFHAEGYKITVGEKEFDIDPAMLESSVTGIEVIEDGIRYKVGEKKIDLTDPEQRVTQENDLFSIKDKDDKELVTFSFEENGRVKILDNGDILFSGDAKIISPPYEINVKDSDGLPGTLTMTENGIRAKVSGNQIQVNQVDEKLLFTLQETPENGILITTKDDIPFPEENLDAFMIDPKNKKIYIPEADDAKGFIDTVNKEYKVYSNKFPDGVGLDTSLAFGGRGGGDINQKRGGGSNSDTGSRYGGNQGTRNQETGGLFSSGAGGINSFLPLLLAGGGILLALLLLNQDDEEESNEATEFNAQNDSIDYQDNTDSSSKNFPVTTGKTDTSTPKIQSIYNDNEPEVTTGTAA